MRSLGCLQESWRFTHNRDLVPSWPPTWVGFHHLAREVWQVDFGAAGVSCCSILWHSSPIATEKSAHLEPVDQRIMRDRAPLCKPVPLRVLWMLMMCVPEMLVRGMIETDMPCMITAEGITELM